MKALFLVSQRELYMYMFPEQSSVRLSPACLRASSSSVPMSGIWNIPGTVDNSIRTSITMKDMKRLQVLQNKTMRLETNLDFQTPTSDLLKQTGKLSVHQMVAYSTSVQMYNISRTYEPSYHYERLFTGQRDSLTRGGADRRVYH